MIDECLRDLAQVIAWSDRIEDSFLLEDEQDIDQLLKAPIDHILPITVFPRIVQIDSRILLLVNVILPCGFYLLEALNALVPVGAGLVGFNGCWNLLLELEPSFLSSH